MVEEQAVQYTLLQFLQAVMVPALQPLSVHRESDPPAVRSIPPVSALWMTSESQSNQDPGTQPQTGHTLHLRGKSQDIGPSSTDNRNPVPSLLHVLRNRLLSQSACGRRVRTILFEAAVFLPTLPVWTENT